MILPMNKKMTQGGQTMDKKEFFYAIVTIVAFAYIGVLLAFRG